MFCGWNPGEPVAPSPWWQHQIQLDEQFGNQ